ncbi:hypothetical protein LPJ72_002772 [Coemansia sp. Benny D160-2]|nr:hypothetical protein LPJ72_002772 [Coemansia sp. Benny D160-2]
MKSSPVRIHSDIQRRIDSYTDLIPVELHAFWAKADTQFVHGRLVSSNVIAYPTYWYSPSTRHQLGFWTFNGSEQLPQGEAVQETTLLSLLDDVTAELATRIITSLNDNQLHLGFTVNLNIKRTDCSPSARTFYFDAYTTKLTTRKTVVECPLYDAESGKLLLTACATFVFFPLSAAADKVKNTSEESDSVVYEPPSPLLDEADALALDNSDLHSLSQVMNVLPHGLITHKAGSFSPSKRRIVVLADFDKDLDGPPNHVHGGLLATVLYNASELLFAKTTGIGRTSCAAAVRDTNYLRGVPSESRNILIDAAVEDISDSGVVVSAKLMHGSKVCTTLRTTFAIPTLTSKL